MKNVLFALVLVSAVNANARIKAYTGKIGTPNADYKEMYLANGKQVSDAQAFQAAMNNEEVFRCVSQEVGMSKSGHGASLKNSKKME